MFLVVRRHQHHRAWSLVGATTQLRSLVDGSYLDRAEPVIFLGAAGTGKTPLMTKILVDGGTEGWLKADAAGVHSIDLLAPRQSASAFPTVEDSACAVETNSSTCNEPRSMTRAASAWLGRPGTRCGRRWLRGPS